jgi:ABC-type transport system involved in cytochrome c biogenesis permease component
MLCIFEVVIVSFVCIVFNLQAKDNWLALIGVLFLGNLGISSVGTLFSAVVQLSSTLLSILVIVLLIPMMVPAIFVSMIIFGIIDSQLVGTGALAFVGTYDAAVGYMIAFDALFIVTCWLLFGFAIKE